MTAAARRTLISLFVVWLTLAHASAFSQDDATDIGTSDPAPETEETTAADVPETVEIDPVASDEKIAARLVGIMDATEWFTDSDVRVEDGVAFISGETTSETRREWVATLAKRTESVTAVVNKVTVVEPDLFDLSPAFNEVESLARQTILMLPKLALACVILLLTYLAATFTKKIARHVLGRRVVSELLQQVLANVAALPVILGGTYLALRVSGLTQLAATVVGGTGLFGLVVGIAFRDIAENFLASLLISVNRPFAIGDLVEIEGDEGYVQSVTTRGTMLLTLEGNHVHIPNSTVYKATVVNRTANPNRREEFFIGIDYEDDVAAAQELALERLNASDYVLADPAPAVLVHTLGTSTIDLRVLYWVDGSRYSTLKVRSTLIRQLKGALTSAGFHFPDGDREMVFPREIPIRLLEGNNAPEDKRPSNHSVNDDALAGGEQNMGTEEDDLKRQAERSRQPTAGDTLQST